MQAPSPRSHEPRSATPDLEGLLDSITVRPARKLALNRSPGSIQWTTSPTLELTALVGTHLADLGIEPAVLLGRKLSACATLNGDRLFDVAAHEQALAGDPVSIDQRIGDRVYHVHIQRFHDAEGGVCGCFGSAIDALPRAELEASLVRHRTMLAKAQEVARVGSWEWRMATGEVVCSEGLYRILGLAPAATLTFRELLERVHPDDRERARDVAADAIVHGKVDPPPDFRVVRSDGATRLIWCDGREIESAAGEARTTWIGTVQDITRLRRAEDELRANEAVIHSIQQIAADGGSILEARIERVIELGCARFNLEYGFLNRVDRDLQRLTPQDPVLPSELAQLQLAPMALSEVPCGRVVEGDAPVGMHDLDIQAPGRFGAPPLSVRSYLGVPVHVGGAPYGTLCFASRRPQARPASDADVSLLQLIALWVAAEVERGLAAEDLKRSHARVNELAHNMPSLIYRFVLAPDGKMSMPYANEGTRELFGLEPDDVIADVMLLLNCIHPEDFASWEESVRVSAETLERWKWEGRFILPSGDTIWIQAASRPVRGEDGTITWDGAALDVTPHKRAEARARKLESDLAHVTRLHTMGELGSGLAHELNQPLSAIANYAEGCQEILSSDHADTAAVLEACGKITQLAHRAGQIVHRLRNLVRKGEPRRSTVCMNELIQETLEFLQSDPRLKAVELAVSLDSDLPPIFGDSVQLQQVLVNLVRNALDALDEIPRTRRALHVATRRAGAWIYVTVEDNGCGLPSGEESSIFEAFYSTKDAGLGMGLAISRSILDAHGGRLQAGAAEGGGARFSLTFPLESQS